MLNQAIDLHIHTAPDAIARKVTDLEAAVQAKAAGMRAIMLKNHLSPTYARATIASKAVEGIHVFGGLVLNAAVGGINPYAVEPALGMGAKCIWFPTSSAVQHISHFKGDVRQAVPVFTDKGLAVDGLMDILTMIAKADCILATGHLHPMESEKLIGLARQQGVKKIVVTHPEFEACTMTIEKQKELAKQGVFFERCFYAANSAQKLPVASIARDIKEAGWESTVLASDFGQSNNPLPTEGLRLFMQELEKCGIPQSQLRSMVTKHPAGLLGLE